MNQNTLIGIVGVALTALGIYLWAGVLFDDDDAATSGAGASGQQSTQASGRQQASGAIATRPAGQTGAAQAGASGASGGASTGSASGNVNIAALKGSLTNYRMAGSLTSRGQTISFTVEVESNARYKTTATVPGLGNIEFVGYDGATYTKMPGSNTYTTTPATASPFPPDFAIKQLDTFLGTNTALTNDGTKRLSDGSTCTNVKFTDPQGGAGTACYQMVNNRTILRQTTVTSANGTGEFNLDNFGNVKVNKP